MTTSTLADRLRRWAKGMYTTEAATELLIRAFRGRFAQPGHSWIHTEEDDWAWVDFEAITDKTTAVLSGGERRILSLAAGLATGRPVNLSDIITGVDRPHLRLILAAMAHSAGSHRDDDIRADPTTGTLEFVKSGSVYPWPARPTDTAADTSTSAPSSPLTAADARPVHPHQRF